MTADALGQAEALHPGRHQCRRAGEPRSRAGNCIPGPGGPPARAARTPGDHPRLLPAICRTRSGYRVTIVRLARLAALGTPATWHISDRSRARNARRRATVTGAED